MKFMNLKRFASTAMAGVMALSLAVPALANETVITATYAETKLDVTVPANTNATINPYGLPVTLEDAVTTLSGQPITIATPLMILNQSGVALKVGASIATTVESGMTLETTDANDYDTNQNKELYVEFQAFAAPGIDGSSAEDPTTTNPAWAALKDNDAALKVALNSGSSVDAAATGDDLVLREGKDGLAQDGSVAFVRLSGKVAKKAAWEETDKLVATITYSFEPSTYTKSAGTFGAAPLDSSNGTARNITLTLPAGVTPNASGITWTVSNTAAADIEDASTPASGNTPAAYAAKITPNATATGVTVTATFVGTDGLTYTATSAAFNIT